MALCCHLKIFFRPGVVAAQAFDLPSLLFAAQAARARGRAGAGLAARFGGLGGLHQQVDQALEGLATVGFLGTVVAGVDEQHAIGVHAPPGQVPQALAHCGGQAGGVGCVKAQLDGGGDLVDVLPAGSGGAGELVLNLAFIDLYG
jgi:hypothetical protein